MKSYGAHSPAPGLTELEGGEENDRRKLLEAWGGVYWERRTLHGVNRFAHRQELIMNQGHWDFASAMI